MLPLFMSLFVCPQLAATSAHLASRVERHLLNLGPARGEHGLRGKAHGDWKAEQRQTSGNAASSPAAAAAALMPSATPGRLTCHDVVSRRSLLPKPAAQTSCVVSPAASPPPPHWRPIQPLWSSCSAPSAAPTCCPTAGGKPGREQLEAAAKCGGAITVLLIAACRHSPVWIQTARCNLVQSIYAV